MAEAAAAASSSSPAPDADSASASASSSHTPPACSSPGAAKEAPSSPKVVVVEMDVAGRMPGSGCASQASVEDEDDVPITDIYFVSSTHTSTPPPPHPTIHINTLK